jgi:hypothetical protein
VGNLYNHLVSSAGSRPFEIEVSVDETNTPTSIHEHYFIARELRRLGVNWVSLAPRFVGDFEKGVDYIGNLDTFASDVQGHAAVARAIGPYKLSLHSGSDKFSIYPLAQEATRGLVHVKTAGTSYLEALRVLATTEPALFRDILDLSRDEYEAARATYHVSAELAKVPPVSELTDGDLPTLLDDFDARQILHVAYGSALDQYGETLKTALQADENAYYARLKVHFQRHLEPFIS